jgi:hypothetical protein
MIREELSLGAARMAPNKVFPESRANQKQAASLPGFVPANADIGMKHPMDELDLLPSRLA